MSKFLNSIYSIFSDINRLISISFSPFFNTSNITNMGYIFYNCNSLTSINLSNFDTSKVINMNSMFSLCFSLKSINLSNFITSNVNDMGYIFFNCF